MIASLAFGGQCMMRFFLSLSLAATIGAIISPVRAGTLTAGSFGIFGDTASASVSGTNFSATITDTNTGPFFFGGFAPFQFGYSVFNWQAEENSGINYQGIGYLAPNPFGPPPPPSQLL